MVVYVNLQSCIGQKFWLNLKTKFHRQPLQNYLRTSQKWVLFLQVVFYWHSIRVNKPINSFLNVDHVSLNKTAFNHISHKRTSTYLENSIVLKLLLRYDQNSRCVTLCEHTFKAFPDEVWKPKDSMYKRVGA